MCSARSTPHQSIMLVMFFFFEFYHFHSFIHRVVLLTFSRFSSFFPCSWRLAGFLAVGCWLVWLDAYQTFVTVFFIVCLQVSTVRATVGLSYSLTHVSCFLPATTPPPPNKINMKILLITMCPTLSTLYPRPAGFNDYGPPLSLLLVHQVIDSPSQGEVSGRCGSR